MYIDSHTHLYLDSFSNDREEVVKRAINKGVTKLFLPNIDSGTIRSMYEMVDRYKDHCFPMMGLHPTSVKENYLDELETIQAELEKRKFIAIGETGIDLYWDKTFINEQKEAFQKQINWAKTYKLPVVIHARESFDEIFDVLDSTWDERLTGVFHSFTGNLEQAQQALSYQFLIGINGIVTFKNNNIANVVSEIPLNRILLETDAPFLSPVPFRGKRNESSYIVYVAEKISEIHKLSIEKVSEITTQNALKLFKLN